METFNVVLRDFEGNIVFESEDVTEIRTEPLGDLIDIDPEYDEYIQDGMSADAVFLFVLTGNIGITFPLAFHTVEISY